MKQKKGKWIGILLLLLCCVIALAAFWRYRKKVRKTASDDITEYSMELSLGDETYEGVYTGEFKKGVPSGEGVFTGSDEEITCEGTWKKAKPSGDMVITYGDGSVETGSFSSGKRNGLFTTVSAEGGRTDILWHKNKICGTVCTYEDGDLKSSELYVNGEPVSELTGEAKPLTKEMLKDRAALENYVYIEGEVAFAGQTAGRCYCRVKTENLGTFFFSYANAAAKNTDQMILPNMKKGNKVRIYGYFSGQSEDDVINDIQGYGYTYLSIEPLYGVILETDQKSGEEPSLYDQLRSLPYEYYGRAVEDTFTVKRYKKSKDTVYLEALGSADSASGKQQLYYLKYKMESDEIFIEGQEIRIEGYYDGQYKSLSAVRDEEEEDEDEEEEEEEEKGNTSIGNADSDITTARYSLYPLIRVLSVVDE